MEHSVWDSDWVRIRRCVERRADFGGWEDNEIENGGVWIVKPKSNLLLNDSLNFETEWTIILV